MQLDSSAQPSKPKARVPMQSGACSWQRSHTEKQCSSQLKLDDEAAHEKCTKDTDNFTTVV
jgi:hypothetical protein